MTSQHSSQEAPTGQANFLRKHMGRTSVDDRIALTHAKHLSFIARENGTR